MGPRRGVYGALAGRLTAQMAHARSVVVVGVNPLIFKSQSAEVPQVAHKRMTASAPTSIIPSESVFARPRGPSLGNMPRQREALS